MFHVLQGYGEPLPEFVDNEIFEVPPEVMHASEEQGPAAVHGDGVR